MRVCSLRGLAFHPAFVQLTFESGRDSCVRVSERCLVVGSESSQRDSCLPAMYSLSGLADEWEDSQEVREHLRAKRCLFSPALQDEEVRATMACADRNHAVLKPLAKRLLTPEGTVGQLLVPELT